MSTMRQLLRDLPVLKGNPPRFDPAEAPTDPFDLATEWLTAAISAGVPEPHAMTLSTLDEDGAPDARILILKDLAAEGLYFASSAMSQKGQQLATAPKAALTFYWPQLARQIRVRGPVQAAPPQNAQMDFLARSKSAQAIAHMGSQSRVITEADDIGAALQKAEQHVEQFPASVPEHWCLYVLAPQSMEFFQASADRLHLRLRYERSPTGWTPQRLWP